MNYILQDENGNELGRGNISEIKEILENQNTVRLNDGSVIDKYIFEELSKILKDPQVQEEVKNTCPNLKLKFAVAVTSSYKAMTSFRVNIDNCLTSTIWRKYYQIIEAIEQWAEEHLSATEFPTYATQYFILNNNFEIIGMEEDIEEDDNW